MHIFTSFFPFPVVVVAIQLAHHNKCLHVKLGPDFCLCVSGHNFYQIQRKNTTLNATVEILNTLPRFTESFFNLYDSFPKISVSEFVSVKTRPKMQNDEINSSADICRTIFCSSIHV